MAPELVDLVRARVGGAGFQAPVGGRGEYQGPCPVCGGKDRFRVFPDQEPSGELAVKAGARGGYWCRQCDISGDYIQWLVDIEGWDWTKIFEFLGVEGEAPAQRIMPKPRPAPQQARVGRELTDLLPVELPPEKWREHALKFVNECAAQLEHNPHLVQWLEGRGVPLSIARESRLGWHAGKPQRSNRPPCDYRSREGWGLPRILNDNGRPKSIWLPRGLVIPNFRDGELAAVRVRRPNSDVPPDDDKYKLVAGSNQKVTMITPNARDYVVVEAALDGLAIAAAKVDGVGFCSMGTLTAYPDIQAAEWLSEARHILNALDFEPQGKGEKHGNKFRHWWGERFPQCRRTPVPVGKDPGELVEQLGRAALGDWLRSLTAPAIDVSALAPKGTVESAPLPTTKKYQIPDDIEELRVILSVSGTDIHVGESGALLGCQGPEEYHGRVAVLAHRPVVRKWIQEVGELVVNSRNFMKPLEKTR